MVPEQSRELHRRPVRKCGGKGQVVYTPAVIVWYGTECTDLSGLSAEPVRLSVRNVRIVAVRDIFPAERRFQVSIPAGIDNGQSVRIREKGEPGVNGGPRGDLLVEVAVSRHPIFQRQDMHIFSTVPISFAQAALGGDVKIKTVDGDVIYTVKPGTKTDTKIRLGWAKVYRLYVILRSVEITT